MSGGSFNLNAQVLFRTRRDFPSGPGGMSLRFTRFQVFCFIGCEIYFFVAEMWGSYSFPCIASFQDGLSGSLLLLASYVQGLVPLRRPVWNSGSISA